MDGSAVLGYHTEYPPRKCIRCVNCITRTNVINSQFYNCGYYGRKEAYKFALKHDVYSDVPAWCPLLEKWKEEVKSETK